MFKKNSGGLFVLRANVSMYVYDMTGMMILNGMAWRLWFNEFMGICRMVTAVQIMLSN